MKRSWMTFSGFIRPTTYCACLTSIILPPVKFIPTCKRLLHTFRKCKITFPKGHVALGIWNDRLGNYCGDLHVVAYFLDPCFIAEVHASTEDITTPLMAITEKFAPVIFPKDRDIFDIQAAIMSQWSSYKNKASGLFSKEVTWKSASTMPPLDWWTGVIALN